MFQVIGLGLGALTMVYWPIDRILLLIVYLVVLASAMVTIGIVDIMIAVRLLKEQEIFSEFMRGFAYVTLVAGILEVSAFRRRCR